MHTYYWLHIPTGKTGTRIVEACSRGALLEAVNRWNAQQPGVWQYWT